MTHMTNRHVCGTALCVKGGQITPTFPSQSPQQPLKGESRHPFVDMEKWGRDLSNLAQITQTNGRMLSGLGRQLSSLKFQLLTTNLCYGFHPFSCKSMVTMVTLRSHLIMSLSWCGNFQAQTHWHGTGGYQQSSQSHLPTLVPSLLFKNCGMLQYDLAFFPSGPSTVSWLHLILTRTWPPETSAQCLIKQSFPTKSDGKCLWLHGSQPLSKIINNWNLNVCV